MSQQRRSRLFLDASVLTGGIIARWGLEKAVLSLCAAGICRMVLAEVARLEVEENLRSSAARLGEGIAAHCVADFQKLIDLAAPEMVPLPVKSAVIANRHLIRHEADVPVLLSAMAAKPDWLLTNNTKHFTKAAATRCGLRIGTPGEFFSALARVMRAGNDL